jgi:hypothetical protein
MWPWEHLAVGYVAYSLACRLVPGEHRPGMAATAALAFGTQLPDLVDKPLGWGTTLLPNGTSLAHSLLFAVPLVVVVALLARRRGRPAVGVAFGVGYLLHLPSDVLYSVLLGRPAWDASFLLWPLLSAPAQPPGSVFDRAGELVAALLEVLASPAGVTYLLFDGLLLGSALLLWLRDGCPGLDLLIRSR